MQARLDRIPGDIVTEQAAIDRRYQDRTRYTFPIAVTFLGERTRIPAPRTPDPRTKDRAREHHE